MPYERTHEMSIRFRRDSNVEPHTALTTNSLAAAFQQPQPCLLRREPAKFRYGTYAFGRVKHDGPDQSGALGLYRRDLDEDQNEAVPGIGSARCQAHLPKSF